MTANLAAVIALQSRIPPAKKDPGAVLPRHVIGGRGVALCPPVAIVAQSLSADGTDDERRLQTVDAILGERPLIAGQRDIPARLTGLEANDTGKLELAVHNVLTRPCGNPTVAEQPLPVAGAGPVHADPHIRSHHEACQIGSNRSMHVQQGIKSPSTKLPAHIRVATQPASLVKDHELHAFQAREQLMLDAADDPGEFGLRPGALDGPHHRHRMASVTDGGQSKDADSLRRRIKFERHKDRRCGRFENHTAMPRSSALTARALLAILAP